MKVAALFVEKDGPYYGIEGIEPWDMNMDARNYNGPHPVIAHPPCERWGRYWSGGPSVKVKRILGDDRGCFERALWAVRTFGGVLEHPAHSYAFKYFNLMPPCGGGGWTVAGDNKGWVCHVEQGHYGHRARKATWLYCVPILGLPSLKWGPCEGKERMDEGFHSNEERRIARAKGIKPLIRLSRADRIHTPTEFRNMLIKIVTPNGDKK